MATGDVWDNDGAFSTVAFFDMVRKGANHFREAVSWVCYLIYSFLRFIYKR